MANVLNEEKKQQVLALGRLGWSLRRIQQATRIRRETAGAYLKAAGIAVRPPSGWGRRAAKPANEVITDSGAAKPAIPVIPDPLNPNPNPENLSAKGKAKATSKPANENEVITGFGGEMSGSERKGPKCVSSTSFCEPYREAIELGLSRGRNAQAIWQDLVSEYSFASSYQSVQRFVRKLRGAQVPEARVVIVTAPGQEAQVDYGTGPMVRDPQTSKYRRTRLFVMTLGYSRKAVRFLTFRSSSRIWAELHERAFRRLGGCTRIVGIASTKECTSATSADETKRNCAFGSTTLRVSSNCYKVSWTITTFRRLPCSTSSTFSVAPSELPRSEDCARATRSR